MAEHDLLEVAADAIAGLIVPIDTVCWNGAVHAGLQRPGHSFAGQADRLAMPLAKGDATQALGLFQ